MYQLNSDKRKHEKLRELQVTGPQKLVYYGVPFMTKFVIQF